MDNVRTNPKLIVSIPKCQEVTRTSTEPGHSMIDKIKDGVEHLNVV